MKEVLDFIRFLESDMENTKIMKWRWKTVGYEGNLGIYEIM